MVRKGVRREWSVVVGMEWEWEDRVEGVHAGQRGVGWKRSVRLKC